VRTGGGHTPSDLRFYVDSDVEAELDSVTLSCNNKGMTPRKTTPCAIYLRVSQGTFPKPVSLGARAVGWVEAEIQEWLQRQIETSRKANV